MFPEAGGSAAFAREGFNELASFLTGWAMCLGADRAHGARRAVRAPLPERVLGAACDTPWDVAGALVVIGVVAAVNVRGLEPSASASAFLGLVDLVVQVLLVVLGASSSSAPSRSARTCTSASAPSLEQLILACAVAMVAYTGIDTIGGMAGEARDPDPRPAAGARPPACSARWWRCTSRLSPDRASHGHVAYAGARDRGAAAAPRVLERAWLCRRPAGGRHAAGHGDAAVTSLLPPELLARAAPPAARARRGAAPRLRDPLRRDRLRRGRGRRPGDPAGRPPAARASWRARTCTGRCSRSRASRSSVVAMRWRDPARYRPFQVPVNIPVDGRRIPVLAIAGAAATASAWVAVVLLEPGPRTLGSCMDPDRRCRLCGLSPPPRAQPHRAHPASCPARSRGSRSSSRRSSSRSTPTRPTSRPTSSRSPPTWRPSAGASLVLLAFTADPAVRGDGHGDRRPRGERRAPRGPGAGDRRAVRDPRPHDPSAYARSRRLDPGRGHPARLAGDPAARRPASTPDMSPAASWPRPGSGS